MRIKTNRNAKIVADEEVVVDVAPEVIETVFEADDVAELVAEITGEDVQVATDDETGAVEFTIGDTSYTIEPEEGDEVLEATVRTCSGKECKKDIEECDKPEAAVKSSRTVRRISRKK